MGTTVLAALERADYAVLISLASLAVALSALGFQLWSALRLDRANLKVEVGAFVMVEIGGPTVHVIAVKAINHGKRPTKLTSIWLTLYRSRWAHRRFVPRRWRRNAGLVMYDDIDGVQQAAVPTLLDVGGEVTVFYRREVLAESAQGSEWRYCAGTAGASTASGRSRLLRIDKLLEQPGAAQ